MLALVLFGYALSVLAVAILAYPLFYSEPKRRKRAYLAAIADVLGERGLRGRYELIEPIPAWALDSLQPMNLPPARLGTYVPVDPPDNQAFYLLGHPYELLETEARRRVLRYRWTDRVFGTVGILVAVAGAVFAGLGALL